MLYDVDRAPVRRFQDRPKCATPVGGSPSAKCVDQNCCDEKERRHLLVDTASIGTPLVANPRRGIGVPLVSGVSDLSERGHDVVPSALILQRTTDRLRDESAPLTAADPAVKLSDKSLVQTNVHTHAHRFAHKLKDSSGDRQPPGTRSLKASGRD